MPDNDTKSTYEPPNWFWDSRKKGPSIPGIATFAIGRALDLPLQYWLLQSGAGVGLLRRLHLTPVPQIVLPGLVTPLGLSPYHTLIFGLATGSSLKQIYWKLFVSENVMPSQFSVVVSLYNTALNSFNTILALWLATSQEPRDQSSLQAFFTTAPLSLYVGLGLYTVGIFTEWYSEIQRKTFKQQPENKGKPYAGGLFGLSRNINYGGYTLWRMGYSLICGGWTWASLMGVWLAGDFCSRAIPSMDAYCEKRYGAQWTEVREKVPYKLLPWIY